MPTPGVTPVPELPARSCHEPGLHSWTLVCLTGTDVPSDSLAGPPAPGKAVRSVAAPTALASRSVHSSPRTLRVLPFPLALDIHEKLKIPNHIICVPMIVSCGFVFTFICLLHHKLSVDSKIRNCCFSPFSRTVNDPGRFTMLQIFL